MSPSKGRGERPRGRTRRRARTRTSDASDRTPARAERQARPARQREGGRHDARETRVTGVRRRVARSTLAAASACPAVRRCFRPLCTPTPTPPPASFTRRVHSGPTQLNSRESTNQQGGERHEGERERERKSGRPAPSHTPAAGCLVSRRVELVVFVRRLKGNKEGAGAAGEGVGSRRIDNEIMINNIM